MLPLRCGPLLKKREKWRTPVVFTSTFQKTPRYTFRANRAHPPLYFPVDVAHPLQNAVILVRQGYNSALTS
jgi:hypothetical protein